MSRHAKTFRFATRFFPRRFREPTFHLYAFFRTLDDLVDEPGERDVPDGLVRDEIEHWRFWFETGMTSPAPRPEIALPVEQVFVEYRIPTRFALSFLDGLRSDLDSVERSTREDVELYSYQVASTVGLSMACVFGVSDQRTLQAAERLGIAMQLTNILRDIGGDLDRGRIYLPSDLMLKHELTGRSVRQMWRDGSGPDDRLRAVVREMIDWADDHYAAGMTGISGLPTDVQMPVMVAARLYQEILRELERSGCDSLRQRARTTPARKVLEVVRCTFAPRELPDIQSDEAIPVPVVADRDKGRE